jgi:RHS repeat-associated protein
VTGSSASQSCVLSLFPRLWRKPGGLFHLGSHNDDVQLTQVNLGSSDSDAFGYDSNTDAMTQYKFNVNGQSVTGNPTWNTNGTLQSLNIADPFNSSNTQNCTYAHDDLVRLQSVNCGSGWSQTFSYDAFGNISKSGTNSFQPTYSWLTNQMTAIGSSTPTYDANGNVTNDFLHTYAWDAVGRPVTIDGVGVTYDALGRMVEQNKSGTYSEIVYAPGGAKLAIMNGQTLTKAFVSLVGGSMAIYNSSGLAYYRHPDWLGSSRLASTPARAMYFDTAYAPFGESYAQAGTADLSFTSMNQDAVSNLYDFPVREYGIQGRWPSPDPAGLASVSLTDPQTLNRYAFVRNDPVDFFDPQGAAMNKCNWNNMNNPLQGLVGPTPNPPPPPGEAECVTQALETVIADAEGTASQPNGGYGLLIYGTVISAPPEFSSIIGQTGTPANPIYVWNPAALPGNPGILVQAGANKSTAFGRYQINASTAAAYGMTSMSPAAQDAAAATMLQEDGAVTAAMQGNFQQAMWNMGPTWASLPDAPYNQPQISMSQAYADYQTALATLPACQ